MKFYISVIFLLISTIAYGFDHTTTGGKNPVFDTVTCGDISSSTSSVSELERTTATTDSDISVVNIKATSSGNISDNFGSSIVFKAEDDSETAYQLGKISFIRNSADTEGKLIIYGGTNGLENFLNIGSSGTVTIPNTLITSSTLDAAFLYIDVVIIVPSDDTAITAEGGITVGYDSYIRIYGSGGAVDITANPQISDPNVDGAIIKLQCTSASNTVQLDDGTGLSLNGGVSFVMGKNDMITLIWDDGESEWLEQFRSNLD